jgi:hypothetical protein
LLDLRNPQQLGRRDDVPRFFTPRISSFRVPPKVEGLLIRWPKGWRPADVGTGVIVAARDATGLAAGIRSLLSEVGDARRRRSGKNCNCIRAKRSPLSVQRWDQGEYDDD